MPLQFSDNGPAFPEKLVDSLLAGEVVFLCGAGVSAPQLPGFRTLVLNCFEGLRMEMNPSEIRSFDEDRFEEVLGSLSRRIVDHGEVKRTVAALLQPPEIADLANHLTILRLSRNLDNHPVIVTTNFDTLIERALLECETSEQVRLFSSGGQDLPTPGSANFAGIIHLHGRISDEEIQLNETTLVVTSADYGDAYMRSGWASRFLFDLCRSKTIVLVGYSAADAPVRYFFNVLEADRQRFPDLRQVYALDAVDERDEADVRWATLAVEPIAYVKETGESEHIALWRDLKILADVVERPCATRHKWAKDILVKPFAETDQAKKDIITWFLIDHSDLWGVVNNAIDDASWFDFFVDHKVLSDQDATWVVAAWIARDFQSADRFKRAIGWLDRLGKPFADQIARRVSKEKELPHLWLRAWRLLTISQTHLVNDHKQEHELYIYRVNETLKGPIVLYSDIQNALALLTPLLRFAPNHSGLLFGKPVPAPLVRLSDIFSASFTISNTRMAQELIETLVAMPNVDAVMLMASVTDILQAVLQQAIDVEMIQEEYDSISNAVPSIEPHEQNDHCDGVTYLIQLLAHLLPMATEADKVATRGFIDIWQHMPGILGIRLRLHALRNSTLFTDDEAITELGKLNLYEFWWVKREIALVLCERSEKSDPTLVARIEQRILTEGKDYFARYTIKEGEIEWRDHARDTEVWLRLNMLSQAETLSLAGNTELNAIKKRCKHLDREVEDRDYFRSYSYGVRIVVGDAQPIIEAKEENRLEVAQATIESSDFEKKLGWHTYCCTDPHGAFNRLSEVPLDDANAPLWDNLINSLSFPSGEPSTISRELTISIFETLQLARNSFLALINKPLADLYYRAPRHEVPDIAAWWPRIFSIAIKHDKEPLDANRALYEEAINSPGGILTLATLVDIERMKKASIPITNELLDALNSAASADGSQGALSRVVLIRNVSFVLEVEGEKITAQLNKALKGDTPEAAALRAVLISHAISTAATRTFAPHILQGAIEFNASGPDSIADAEAIKAAAANILSPALSIVREEAKNQDWGITLTDTADVLREGHPALREGAVKVLKQWVKDIDGDPAVAWRKAISPLLCKVWPNDTKLHSDGLTRHFAELAVNSGDAFPEALQQLRPFITRIERSVCYNIQQSTTPDKFPCETLELLWLLLGSGDVGDQDVLSSILQRIILADSDIEIDRRLQSLKQRAHHYD